MSIFSRHSIGALLVAGLTLCGCETTNPQEAIQLQIPMASLNAHKKIPPTITSILVLLQNEKYNEASSLINQNLQTEPRNITLHLLNGLVYEKMNELGNAAGKELAAIGYQNVLNLDPSNAFALTQLGKLRYREQNYDQAQELFANALLVKSNDPDLWQELAAASYYNYDLKTALAAINKAIKLKPNDALVHRSAAMIYSALGDFKTSKKHLDVFAQKAGEDPAVNHVKTRYKDWESLYNSGRVRLAAATKTQNSTSSSSKTTSDSTKNSGAGAGAGAGTSTTSNSSGSSGDGGSTTSSTSESSENDISSASNSTDSSEGGTSSSTLTSKKAYDIDTENAAEGALDASFTESDDNTSDSDLSSQTEKTNPQIIVDCYMLRITEDAITSKGQNILENLAVTLNPGSFTRFKGALWGGGTSNVNSNGPTNIVSTTNAGFRANQSAASDTSAQPGFSPGGQTFNLLNKGGFSGHIFAGGITWSGLTYSLNIANARDNRTEVVSRPSLMTFLNKPSVFFSGQELVNGFTGQFGGTLVKYPVGVTLDVTPMSLDGDVITLQVGVEGSILTEANPNLSQTVNVAKTRVDTYAKLHLGETLMLGGIYERVELTSKDGFPGLQDIPIAQYFFSNETTGSRRTSIVYMLTPRSPDAVKAAVNRAMTREAVSPHVRELIARNPDWFNTHTNFVPIFRYLATDPIIYYEFRSADILPPSWGWDPPMKNKLAQAVEFLYY